MLFYAKEYTPKNESYRISLVNNKANENERSSYVPHTKRM